jgi:hypothetical protein
MSNHSEGSANTGGVYSQLVAESTASAFAEFTVSPFPSLRAVRSGANWLKIIRSAASGLRWRV